VGDVNQRLFLTRAIPRAGGPVLEVGAKDYGNTSSFRDVFAGDEYIGIDLSPGKDVDRVLDLAAGTGDLAEAHFALAICCSVLEHVRRPWDMAANITRLVRPGGMVYIAVPWVWRYHAYPDDYFRFSWAGVAELFPEMQWTHRALSTNVPDEFVEITGNGANLDNAFAKYAPTPAGERKYLPYFMVHMLGVRP
jgi:SAM-dependent methyltransferase